MTTNLCPLSVSALNFYALTLRRYAAVCPLADEGDVIMAATHIRAAAALLRPQNAQERLIHAELLEFFKSLDGSEDYAYEIGVLERELVS